MLTITSSEKVPASMPLNDEEQAHLASTPLSKTNTILNSTQRIIWCMFIPDPNETQVADNVSNSHKIFCITRNNKAEIFNMSLIEKNYDCSVELDAQNITVGHLTINEHSSTILTAAFSPDASAITTASADGEVNLFKITFDPQENFSENSVDVNDGNKLSSPKCLKKWNPHGDKPVNSLYFLDNHKDTPNPDEQFWSFLITCNLIKKFLYSIL